MLEIPFLNCTMSKVPLMSHVPLWLEKSFHPGQWLLNRSAGNTITCKILPGGLLNYHRRHRANAMLWKEDERI